MPASPILSKERYDGDPWERREGKVGVRDLDLDPDLGRAEVAAWYVNRQRGGTREVEVGAMVSAGEEVGHLSEGVRQDVTGWDS